MRFFICLLLFGAIPLLSAEEVADFWGNREVVIPGTGKWTLSAEHGRVLCTGSGDARLEIPVSADGAALDTILTRNGKERKVRFHSSKPLIGIHGGIRDLPRAKAQLLHQYGYEIESGLFAEVWFCGFLCPPDSGRLFFVFPGKNDFPLDIGTGWEEISLKTAKIPGTLSVSYDRKEQFLKPGGAFAYAVLKKEKKTFLVFSPDFDWTRIENILLIKKLLTENKR